MGDDLTIPQLERPVEQDHQKPGYLVAGIGASAGGINALQQFFNRVTADSGLAYVVVLHLSPQHASNLAAVLQAVAKIPVTQVTETVRLQANHVYVNPPAKYIVVDNGYLKLVEAERLSQRASLHRSVLSFTGRVLPEGRRRYHPFRNGR